MATERCKIVRWHGLNELTGALLFRLIFLAQLDLLTNFPFPVEAISFDVADVRE